MLLQGMALRLQLEGWGVALHLSTGASVRSQVYEYARRRYLAFMRATHTSGGTQAHTTYAPPPKAWHLHTRTQSARPLHLSHTSLISHLAGRSHAPTCKRPNHTHMILICRRTHPSASHTHTPTRTCPGVNGHTVTPMAAGCRVSPRDSAATLSPAAPRPYAPCSGWLPLCEV